MAKNPEQEKGVKHKPEFFTQGGIPVNRVYGPEDGQARDPEAIGQPGEFPYTRGVHEDMYRGKLWTMRQFAGFGTPAETNARFKDLLAKGQTGLSIAFDMATLYGLDTDDQRAMGEFGTCGVACSSLQDMETLLDGIDLEQVSVSMTINSPAAVIWAMFLAAAEKRGVPFEKLRGTLQNDILKEYIAQKEYIFPPRPSMRLVVDTVEYATRFVPKWNSISISGYHIREAGATAVQELAFTLADGLAYVDACLERGLKVDEFAPRLSFFWDIHNDFFEEIAKFRAARRIWSRFLRDKHGAEDERSWLLRCHAQTAGVSLTAQQPENNIVRVAIQALAGVLGGTQSLHTDAMDEALAVPSQKAATIALRTQQIIAYESGVTNVVDPLGGSWFVEALTDQMETEALEYINRIAELGGVMQAIEYGFMQGEIADSASRYNREVEDKKRIIVGVNEFKDESEKMSIPWVDIDPQGFEIQKARLEALRAGRDQEQVKAALDNLRLVCSGKENVMPALIQACKAYCTMSEMMDVMKKVFGEYQEPNWF